MTVNQLYAAYLKSHRVKKTTERHYNTVLKPILEAIGDRQIDTIRFTDYENLKVILSRGKQKRSKKVSTINQSLTVIRMVMAYGVNLGLLQVSPFQGARNLKCGVRHRDFLSIEERDLMLARCRELRHKVLLEMSVFTGLRKSELFGLRWEDICWQTKTLTVKRSMDRLGQTKDYVKTESSLRTIPLAEKLIWRLKDNVDTKGYMFAPSPSEFKNPTKYILKKYTDRKVCWHSLRNTFASALVEKNVSLVKIAFLLGHTKVSNTLYRYARVHSTSQLHTEVNLI